MAGQIPLPLSYPPLKSREDFLIAPCNEEAVAWMDAYQTWPFHAALIYGEEGCGKSHLAHIFTKHVMPAKTLKMEDIPYLPSKVALEDIDDGADENVLFHLYNFAKENKSTILMTAKAMPMWKLPDLKTRMSTVPAIRIHAPDDFLMMSLLCKLFTDRHVDVDSDVISYLLVHLNRSFKALHQVVAQADILSLSQKRRITIPLIKQALEEVCKQSLF